MIFKYPEDVVLARDSFYVESFNNVMNIFQDKRINFSDQQQYRISSQLAVLYWKEREYTSIWNPKDQRAPRRRVERKVYKAVKYQYRKNIWDTYMASIFDPSRRRVRITQWKSKIQYNVIYVQCVNTPMQRKKKKKKKKKKNSEKKKCNIMRSIK